ncbi:probable protein disulfide-isomerase DDB_G0275025 [Coccomyxa sp. Obi]|nr:probable protein disulfide-isomerase DDB_G0275025 [Coccomyxa sp. Obi]
MISTVLLCLLIGLGSTDALYSPSGPVKLLNKKNFKSEILDSNLPSIVEFFAPWCGHCKALAPTYTKVAENLQGMVNVAAVDCDDASLKSLCGKYGVQGFPTLKLFPSDKQKNPYTKKTDKTPTDYNGPRSAKAIADAGLALLPDTFITTLRGHSSFDAFVAASALPKVVLASSKSKPTALYKSLSLTFKGRMAFAVVKDSDSEIIEKLGTTTFPSLIILTPDGETVVYDGKFKVKELSKFLSKHAAEASAKDADSSQSKGKTDADTDDEGNNGQDKVVPQAVQDLTLEALEKISTDEDPWLVAFFADDDGTKCATALKDFNKVVAELGPLIKAGQFNTSSEEGADKARSYGVSPEDLKTSPCKLDIALANFDEKGDTEEWPHFTGEMKSRDLQKFAMEAFPSFVTRISAATMQTFLGPDPTVPCVILFTDKDTTPPVFAALSVNLRKYRYKFADAHSSDTALMSQFNIKKVPTMVIVHMKPGEEEAAAKEGKLGLQQYPGPLKYPYMHSFLATFAGMLGAAPPGGDGEPSFMDVIGDAQAASAPIEVPQAATNADLRARCIDQSGLCVLALLDANDPNFEKQLGIVRGVGGRWKKQPLHFSWVDAARQGRFLSAFGLSTSDIPTVVTFSPKKLRGAQLTGAYSMEGIHQLLDGLFSGKIHSSPFQELPELVEGGEDETAVDEPVEEEFDLADILGEEVSGSGSKADLLKKVEEELKEEERKRAEAEAAEAKAASEKKKGGKKKKKRKTKTSKEEL